MRKLTPLLYRCGMGVKSRLRNIVYRALGVRMTGYVWMRAVEIPRMWGSITLHGCALDRGVVLLCSGEPAAGKLVIGHGTYINRYTVIDAHERLEIGRDVMIGPHCYLTDGDHGTEPGRTVKSQPMRMKPVVVGDGAWIGAGVTILSGVTIGAGAVIGAGSVVTRDVPADAIACGVPARVTRQRGERKG